MPLPTITERTVSMLFEHFAAPGSWGKFLEEGKVALRKDDPVLVKFIESQVAKFPPEQHDALFEIFVATVAVLKYQADLDDLTNRPLLFNLVRKF